MMVGKMTLTTGLPGLPNNSPTELTIEQVKSAVPPNLRNHISPAFVDQVNNLVQDPLIAEQVRNNFLSYSGVMKEGKFKLEDYLNAVAYCSYKLMGYSSRDSYERTFPDRMNHLIGKGTSDKDISAYVAAYNRGKLVNLILEMSMVPSWVLNQHVYQEAINTQAEIMRTAHSDKVRSDAANSILTHLGKPKDADFQISVDIKENSGLAEMKQLIGQLAQAQQDAITSGGMGVRDIAAQPLIDITPNKGGTEDGTG
jgi:hypothetical protein